MPLTAARGMIRGQTLGQTHGLEDKQRYATLWAMKDTAGGGQDNTAA
jgi:hypothetical protein